MRNLGFIFHIVQVNISTHKKVNLPTVMSATLARKPCTMANLITVTWETLGRKPMANHSKGMGG